MKSFLILVTIVCFGFSTNAQNKIAFYNGSKYIVLYQNGTAGYWDGNNNYEGQWAEKGSPQNPSGKAGNIWSKHQPISILVIDKKGEKKSISTDLHGFDIKTWKRKESHGNRGTYMYIDGTEFKYR